MAQALPILHNSGLTLAAMLDNLDLNAIQDENARELIRRLLNLIEQLSADLRQAQAESQRLRDENKRLKGEQGSTSTAKWCAIRFTAPTKPRPPRNARPCWMCCSSGVNVVSG